MDFVYKLPRTRNGYDGIWVVVDRLTKSAHFIPVRENYSMSQLAERFISEVVKYHGVPVSIISDRDPRFYFEVLGSFSASIWIKITLQHSLSSSNRWAVRENYPDSGRYVEIVSSAVWRCLA